MKPNGLIQLFDNLGHHRFTKVSLKEKKMPEGIYKFVVNGSYMYAYEPYRPPPISFEESYMKSFLLFLDMLVQQLIFSILSNYGPELGYLSGSIRILSHYTTY
jgi:hypothetical protein